jgi:hypothetical protein
MRNVAKTVNTLILGVAIVTTAHFVTSGMTKLFDWSSEKFTDWRKKRAIRKAAKEEIEINRK